MVETAECLARGERRIAVVCFRATPAQKQKLPLIMVPEGIFYERMSPRFPQVMQDLADPTFIHDRADKKQPHEISGSELKDINRGRRFLEVCLVCNRNWVLFICASHLLCACTTRGRHARTSGRIKTKRADNPDVTWGNAWVACTS